MGGAFMSWLDTVEQIRTRDFKKVPGPQRDKTARELINACSYAAAAVAVSPIPFSEELVMLPVQIGMVGAIGHIYGRKMTRAEAKELLVEIAAVAGTGFLARQGVKALLPVVGALLTMPAAYAANWAIGRVAIEHFKNPKLSRERLKKLYETALKEGRKFAKREQPKKAARRKENRA